jgi:hypothetical protein
MTGERISVFENADDLDLGSFAPQPKSRKPKPSPEQVRAVSEAAKFPSRQASAPYAEPAVSYESPLRKPRYHKTGRTAQLNTRVMPETFEAVYALAEKQGWLIGETVEKAVDALLRELKRGKKEQGT